MIRKLEQRFTIKELFKPISRELRLLIKRYRVLNGFKLQFKGRLNRRDRSRAVINWGGKLPLGSSGVPIDYSYTRTQLRNGSCGVKVWLYKTPKMNSFAYIIF